MNGLVSTNECMKPGLLPQLGGNTTEERDLEFGLTINILVM